jgi:1-hydroxycarotenoid 3,4-desaturase
VSKSFYSNLGGGVRDPVVVIGAGVGGLVCALELARSGVPVTVVEQGPHPGGKMRQIAVGDNARVDSGPTVFTMRWVFDAIFEAAGASLDSHLQLRPARILARHAWNGEARLDLFADLNETADAIGVLAGRAEAAGYRAFCAQSRRIYETLRDTFLTAQQTDPLGLALRIGLGRIPDLMGLRPFDTMWSALGRHFRDPRLRQLFGRYATYCGSSPFAAPATLMLIAHVEREGVWTVEGGMQRLPEALASLGAAHGVTYRYDAKAARIDAAGGQVSGVILTDGERLAASAVVVNADAQALAGGLFGAGVAPATPARPARDRSLSAVTWSMLARARNFPLVRHNVFFSGDYRAEFEDIGRLGRLPRAPTIYICAQDREDDAPSPAGLERLFILVNAPPSGDARAFSEAEVAACETTVFEHLARCGLQVIPERATSRITTPDQFATMFPATGGALYGAATHGWAAAFRRPAARTRIRGLYLAGGGAHPGGGVPMAALSGRSAARRLMADRGSTRPFHQGATPGGTSTP